MFDSGYFSDLTQKCSFPMQPYYSDTSANEENVFWNHIR